MPRKVSELNEVHPLDCLVVLQVRSENSERTWFYDHGYIRYYDGTKVMLREHQRVAAIAYGVPDGFHVHHIDGDRMNNRADNLAVLSPSEHQQLHGQIYRSQAVVICAICGNAFEAHLNRVLRRNVTCCSETCRHLASRKVKRPSSDTLAALIREVGNWSELGRKFGVSDNAVRKWARAYNLL